MILKRKILTGYGILFALMVAVVAWAILNLVSLGKATDAILSENYRSILAAGNMVEALERQDSAILLMASGEWEKGAAQFRENEAPFIEWLTRAKDNITIEGEADLVGSIERAYDAYRRYFQGLVENRPPGGSALSPEGYLERAYPLFRDTRQLCIELRMLNERSMYAASLRAGHVAGRAIWSTALVAGAAIFLAFVFSVVLAERIVRPIRDLMSASRKIASGDYDIRVPAGTGDEIALLGVEFSEMAAQLKHFHRMNIDQLIAERNKGEAIISSIEDGLVLFDTNLVAASVNPAARRMLGLDAAGGSTFRCREVLPEKKVCGLIEDVMNDSSGKIGLPEEQRILSVRKGEEIRHLLFSVTPIRGTEGAVSGVVLLLRDVTRLKEVDRLKSEFVMAASHELRTPLTGLGMSIDLLMEHLAPELSEKDRELLQAAQEETQRMKALVSDLLDMSKMEAGQIEMEFENVEVLPLLESVESIFRKQAEIRNVSLSVENPENLPRVRADSSKIVWVLSNLVSNALRYVPNEGHIRLWARKGGAQFHFSVSDDGPGIPAESQSKLFQKFVRIKDREAEGSGLGLAICKEILRAHGGAIWVESEPGKGCTFTFTLPIAEKGEE